MKNIPAPAAAPLPEFLTPAAYATACGVSRQAIAARLKAGTLTTTPLTVKPGEVREVIDTNLYPPANLASRVGLPPLLTHRLRKPRSSK